MRFKLRMEAFQLDSREWHDIVERLGGATALAESARRHQAFVRARGVKSATDLLRLAFMYGPGGQSLRMLAAAASTDGVAEVSDVALLKRLRGAADWLEALCGDWLAGPLPGTRPPEFDRPELDPAGTAGPLSGRPIRLVDGSRLGADFKLHLGYDPVAGRIASARITSCAHGEKLDRLAIEPGEIRVADRGFPKQNGLRNTLAAGADVVVRLTWNSLVLSDAAGRTLDWLALFSTAKRDGALDMPVAVGKPNGAVQPLAMRLVIIEKPPDAGRRARDAARKTNRRKGRKWIDPRTLAGAEHMVLVTSLPEALMPIAHLAELYRIRWQIELAFKRLKSILDIERRPAKDERLARAWLHAHLLFALIIDAARQESGALSP